jgi:hypothetical protein
VNCERPFSALIHVSPALSVDPDADDEYRHPYAVSQPITPSTPPPTPPPKASELVERSRSPSPPPTPLKNGTDMERTRSRLGIARMDFNLFHDSEEDAIYDEAQAYWGTPIRDLEVRCYEDEDIAELKMAIKRLRLLR